MSIQSTLDQMRRAVNEGAGRISGIRTAITIGEIVGPIDPRMVCTGNYNVRLLGNLGHVLHNVRVIHPVGQVSANGATEFFHLRPGDRVLVIFDSNNLQPYILGSISTSDGPGNCSHEPDKRTEKDYYVYPNAPAIQEHPARIELGLCNGTTQPIEIPCRDNNMNPDELAGVTVPGYTVLYDQQGNVYEYNPGNIYILNGGKIHTWTPGSSHSVPVETQMFIGRVQDMTENLVKRLDTGGRGVQTPEGGGSRFGPYESRSEPTQQGQIDQMVVQMEQNQYIISIQERLQRWMMAWEMLVEGKAKILLQEWGVSGEFGIHLVEDKQPGNSQEGSADNKKRPTPHAQWKEGGLLPSIIQQVAQAPIFNSKNLNSGGGGSPAIGTPGPARGGHQPLVDGKRFRQELLDTLKREGIGTKEFYIIGNLSLLLQKLHLPWPHKLAVAIRNLILERDDLNAVVDLFFYLGQPDVSLACAGLKLLFNPEALPNLLQDLGELWFIHRNHRELPSYLAERLQKIAQGQEGEWESWCRYLHLEPVRLGELVLKPGETVGRFLEKKGVDFAVLGTCIDEGDALNLILAVMAYGEGISWSSAQALKEELRAWVDHYLKRYIWIP